MKERIACFTIDVQRISWIFRGWGDREERNKAFYTMWVAYCVFALVKKMYCAQGDQDTQR